MVKKYNFGHFEPKNPKNREKPANLANFQFFELKIWPKKIHEKSQEMTINKAKLQIIDNY